MAIDYDRLMAREFPLVEKAYTWRDSALYALGLGLGADPLSAMDLRYVYEKDMATLPTMAVVMGHPGFWIADPEAGLTFRQVVHGEQSLEVFEPLPTEGVVIARNSIDEIIDKGEGRGALLRVRRDLYLKGSDTLQSSQVMSMFCRADGGFGGPPGKPVQSVEIPGRVPDLSLSLATLPQLALIYRLSGDYNPLHADPEIARGAGFDRPILHGLATYGMAGYALVSAIAGGNGAALRKLSCRFSAPVFPGETLRTDMWREGDGVLFRCTAVERDKVVLDRGEAIFS